MKKLMMMALMMCFGILMSMGQNYGTTPCGARFIDSTTLNTFTVSTGVPTIGQIQFAPQWVSFDGGGGIYNPQTLYKTKNPMWFYFQVLDSGNVNIKMWSYKETDSSSFDIDYVCWGPFNNLDSVCSINNILLSNDTVIWAHDYTPYPTDVEPYLNFNMQNAAPGIYILLVTNPANCNGTVNLDFFGSTANISHTPPQSIDTSHAPIASFVSTPIDTISNPYQYHFYNFAANTDSISWTIKNNIFKNISITIDTTSNSIEYTFIENGVYKITEKVINSHGYDTTSKTISISGIVLTPTSPPLIKTTDFSLYPNITPDKITFNTALPNTKFRIDIYNIEGQFMRNYEFENPSNEIDISRFAEGVYILRIHYNGCESLIKVVKI